VFERIGGFDEEMVRNQDDEFNYRLQASGGKILLTDRIRSRYFNRADLRSLWRQYYQYGMYKVRVLQKHPLQMRPRQFAPPILAAAVVGGGLLSLLLRVRLVRTLWRFVTSLYVMANLGASIYMAAKNGWQYLRMFPVIFAALHFGYGLGFLRGLVKFADRWKR
ncbi:MAG: glycosyltransferase family 2 protein, partial [Anaerolineae bacterium]|nr:glycosyltransferase family 2 protein [Anaerolineae bacterium]